MNANHRNISDLRYLARNNLIVPYNLDIRKTERSPNRNPVFPQFSKLPLYNEILRILTKIRKFHYI